MHYMSLYCSELNTSRSAACYIELQYSKRINCSRNAVCNGDLEMIVSNFFFLPLSFLLILAMGKCIEQKCMNYPKSTRLSGAISTWDRETVWKIPIININYCLVWNMWYCDSKDYTSSAHGHYINIYISEYCITEC